jgi:Tol biopolymer transport system component
MMYRSILAISLGLALTQLPKLAGDQKAGPVASAREITGEVHTYDQVLPVCSPDGHWLAFEYHETNDPNYPRVGIMDLSQDSHPWHPLLEVKPGRHLFAEDMSWSPDSQWLALLTDYPKGKENFWSDSDIQVVKINIKTHEVVRLTNFAIDTPVNPNTAWLRSGWIVFSAVDENIYAVSEKGGELRQLVNVPKDKCGGGTNTFAVSPDEQKIAFVMNGSGSKQADECNALWIADLQKGALQRAWTTGLLPLSPFWLDNDTIFFAGEKDNKPVGIYKLSLNTGNLTHLLEGHYLTPFVCDSGKMLYFSWGPNLQAKPSGSDWTFNDFSGFSIWRVPLGDVLQQRSGQEQSGVNKTVNPKTGNVHLQIPIPATTKNNSP